MPPTDIIRIRPSSYTKGALTAQKRLDMNTALIAQQEARKVMEREIEVKNALTFNTFYIGGYNSATALPLSIIPITPYTGFVDIDQNAEQDGRIGNKIRTKKVMLSLVIYPLQYDATTNLFPFPQEVMIFILSNKTNPTVRPTSIPSLIQYGNTTQSLTSSLQDICNVPIGWNKDLYVVHKVIVKKLGPSQWPIGNPGFAANTASGPNNDFKLNHVLHIDVTKYCPKTITFNDGTNSASSRMTYFYVQAVPANGYVQTNTQLPCECYTRVDYTYTD